MLNGAGVNDEMVLQILRIILYHNKLHSITMSGAEAKDKSQHQMTRASSRHAGENNSTFKCFSISPLSHT
jgi:hypothetical protein